MSTEILIEKIKQLSPKEMVMVENFIKEIHQNENPNQGSIKNLIGKFEGKIKIEEGFDDPIEGKNL